MGWFVESKMRCPICGSVVPGSHAPGGTLECKHCNAKLQIARKRLRASFRISVLIAFAFCFFIGFRGWALVLASIAGYFVVGYISADIQMRFVPPPLEPFDPGARHFRLPSL